MYADLQKYSDDLASVMRQLQILADVSIAGDTEGPDDWKAASVATYANRYKLL